jgi:hypothetical protein
LWATAAVIDVQDSRLRGTEQCKYVDFRDPIWPVDLPSLHDGPFAAKVLVIWPH